MTPQRRRHVERWAPWALLLAIIVLWQLICSGFNVSEFIFPSPRAIGEKLVEFRGVIAGHAWRTYWVTMAGFGLAIVVGVLLGFLVGSSRLAYAAFYPLMTAFNALPKAAFVPILVVWIEHPARCFLIHPSPTPPANGRAGAPPSSQRWSRSRWRGSRWWAPWPRMCWPTGRAV